MVNRKQSLVIALACAAFVMGGAWSSAESEKVCGAENPDVAKQWKALGGAEGQVTLSDEQAHEGGHSAKFTVKVDWSKGANPKYPKGWPMLQRVFSGPQDWSGAKEMEFYLMIPEGALKKPAGNNPVFRYGVRAENNTVKWHDVKYADVETGKWMRLSVPLTKEAVNGDLAKVTAAAFYVAEGWFQDGDELVYYIDDLALVK